MPTARSARSAVFRGLTVVCCVFACAAAPATRPAASLSPGDAEMLRRVQCSANVSTLTKFAIVYAVENDDKFPPDLGTLLIAENLELTRFICPDAPSALPANWKKLAPKDQAAWVNAHSDYILVRPKGNNDTDSDKPLVYEKDDDHKGGGMWVGYSDGHIAFLSMADVHKKIGPTAGAQRTNTRVAPAPGQPPAIPLPSVDEAKAIFAHVALADIAVAVDAFEIDLGRYPTTAEGLGALLKKPANAAAWKGPYLSKPPTDPWGHPYLYTFDGKAVHVSSAGPDGKPNTPDDVKSEDSR